MGLARPNTVELLPSTAEALDGVVCHVGRVNASLGDMAWLALVCRDLPNTEEYFPRGKWATIQRLDEQLHVAAKAAVAEILQQEKLHGHRSGG